MTSSFNNIRSSFFQRRIFFMCIKLFNVLIFIYEILAMQIMKQVYVVDTVMCMLWAKQLVAKHLTGFNFVLFILKE